MIGASRLEIAGNIRLCANAERPDEILWRDVQDTLSIQVVLAAPKEVQVNLPVPFQAAALGAFGVLAAREPVRGKYTMIAA